MPDDISRPTGKPTKEVKPRERRSNVDRSAATRRQILEATVRALDEFGYGAVTNHLVAELAGVSRGAMIHHFPTRQDLLAAVTEYAYGKMTEYRISELEKLQPGLPRFRGIINLAFETGGSPEGLAINEIRMGSRSDSDIAEAVTPMMGRIADDYGRFIGRHVRAAGLIPDKEMQGLSAAAALAAQTLAINRATNPSPQMVQNVLVMLKAAREHIIARQLGPEMALSLEQLEREPLPRRRRMRRMRRISRG
jgi:AcrR family transcriptional regulator